MINYLGLQGTVFYCSGKSRCYTCFSSLVIGKQTVLFKIYISSRHRVARVFSLLLKPLLEIIS